MNLRSLTNQQKKWINFIPFFTLIFIIGFNNLSTNLVEGDEARILCHYLSNGVFDRYTFIQTGFDFFVRLFICHPSFYSLLLAVSFLCQVLSIFFMASVAVNLLNIDGKHLGFIALLSILSMPEIIWQSLYINPSAIALFFSSFSFWLFINLANNENTNSKKQFIFQFALAAFFLCLSFLFRWTHGLVLLSLLTLIIVFKRELFPKFIIYSLTGFIFFLLLLFLLLDNININNFLVGIKTLKLSANEFAEGNMRLNLLSNLIFFTPVFLFTFSRKSIFFYVSIFIGLFIIFPAIVPKYYNFNHIIFITLIGIAFQKIKNFQFYGRFIFMLILFLPWFLGVNIYSKSSAWGPKFEYQPISNKIDYSITKIGVSFQGMCIPTPEGIRSVGGYFHSLVKGNWRKLNSRFYEASLPILKLDSAIILKLDDNMFLEYRLLINGYEVSEKIFGNNKFVQFRKDHKEILIYQSNEKNINWIFIFKSKIYPYLKPKYFIITSLYSQVTSELKINDKSDNLLWKNYFYAEVKNHVNLKY